MKKGIKIALGILGGVGVLALASQSSSDDSTTGAGGGSFFTILREAAGGTTEPTTDTFTITPITDDVAGEDEGIISATSTPSKSSGGQIKENDPVGTTYPIYNEAGLITGYEVQTAQGGVSTNQPELYGGTGFAEGQEQSLISNTPVQNSNSLRTSPSVKQSTGLNFLKGLF